MNINFSGAGVSSGGSISTGQQSTARPVTGVIIGIIMLVLGVVMGGLLVSQGNHDSRLIKDGVQTQGTVTDVKQSKSRSTGSSSSNRSGTSKVKNKETVTVSYTVDNSTYTIKNTEKVNTAGFEPTVPNSMVNVYYDADKPAEAIVKGWESSPMMGYLLGGFFALAGLVAAGVSARRIFS